MRGIEIIFNDCFDLTRFLSLDGIDLSSYTIFCIDSSAYCCSLRRRISEIINFEQLIQLSKSKVILERFHLQLFPVGNVHTKVSTYDEFLCSPCEMIILAYDGVHMEVYAKQQQWLEQLQNNATCINGTSVEIKTLKNDTRKEFYV